MANRSSPLRGRSESRSESRFSLPSCSQYHHLDGSGSPRRGRSLPAISSSPSPFHGVRRDGGSIRPTSSIGGRSSSVDRGSAVRSSSGGGVNRRASDCRSAVRSSGGGVDRRASDHGCMTPRTMAGVWKKNKVSKYAMSRPFNSSKKSLGGGCEITTKKLVGSSKTNSQMVFHTKKPLQISSLGAYRNPNSRSRSYWTIPEYAVDVIKGRLNSGPAVNILKFINTFAFVRVHTNRSKKALQLANKFELVFHSIHQLLYQAIKSDIQFSREWFDLIIKEIPNILEIYVILGGKSSIEFLKGQWDGHGVILEHNPLRFFRLGIKLFLQYSPGLQTALLANYIVVERGSILRPKKYAAKLARNCVFDLKKLLGVEVVLFARYWRSEKLTLLYELGICMDNNNTNVDCPQEIQYQVCNPSDLLILGPI